MDDDTVLFAPDRGAASGETTGTAAGAGDADDAGAVPVLPAATVPNCLFLLLAPSALTIRVPPAELELKLELKLSLP